MKKLILISFLFISGGLMAQMDNLSNLSAEWIRTGARNAATNGVDAAVYNPAGLTALTPGFHLSLSNQSLFRKPSHSYDLGLGEGQKTFSQSGSDPLLPGLFMSYNKSKWAFHGAAYIAGGGATMNYPNGSLTTDLIALQALMASGGAYMTTNAQSIKASSYYLSLLAGAAYKASDKFSVSFGVRSISASNKAEGGVTLTASPIDLPDMPLGIEYEETGSGIGFIAGINYSFSEKFNVSARYESQTKLELKTKQISDDLGLTTDGDKNRRDLPAVAAIGMSFQATPAVRAYYDFNYFFQENADWGKSSVLTEEKPLSSLAGDVYGMGLGVEIKFTEKMLVSFGGGYSNYLYNDKAGYYTQLGTFEVIQDDNTNINLGFAYSVSQKIKLNAGYMHTFWSSDSKVDALLAQPLEVEVTTNNKLDALALGVEFTF